MVTDIAAQTEPDLHVSDVDRETPVLHYRPFSFHGHALYR
jgi:hypothetical protein